MVRRKAIRIVVEPLHGQHEERVPDDIADNGTCNAHDGRQRHVVDDELTFAPSARQQRANHRAFLLYGRIGEHDEDERHDHDEHDEQDLPHHLVTLRIVERVDHRLIRIAVHEIGHELALVRKHVEHVLLERRAVNERHRTVVQEEGVAVDERPLAYAVKGLLRDLGDRKAERVEYETRIVLEQARVIGQRHYADERHGPTGNLDHISHLQLVVVAEHAVERDLVIGFRRPALTVDRLVALAPVYEDARLRSIRRPIEHERRVVIELLHNRAPERFDRPNRLLVGFERRGEMPVLSAVIVAHVRPDELDGARRDQEPRRERDGKCKQQEHAEVFAQIVLELAGKTF